MNSVPGIIDMHVHFLCDHKWRDLPTVAAMKLMLELKGVKVTVASSRETFPLLAVLRPHAIVLNHMYSQKHQQLAARLRAAGMAIIVLPTEGKGEPLVDRMIWGDFNDYSNIDLFLAWNERTIREFEKNGKLPMDRVRLTGCTRYDYYRKPWFDAVKSKQDFCARFGLDADRPLVTWTTKFGYARIDGDQEAETRFVTDFQALSVFNCYAEKNVDWKRLPFVHAETRRQAAEVFFDAVACRPDMQFVIKPHPTEERSFYEEHIARRSLANVKVIYGEYIWDVLNATDVLVQQRCSTALESWLLGKPSIELTIYDEEDFFWPSYEAGSHRVRDREALLEKIDELLSGPEKVTEVMQESRDFNIRDFAWKVDGNRSALAADQIVEFLGGRPTARPKLSFADVDTTPKAGWRGWLRYRLGIPASRGTLDHLLGRSAAKGNSVKEQLDKEITRFDVDAWCQMIRPRIKNNIFDPAA